MKLKGQVAIVTGASSGVGWATALRLAEAGVSLCVTARRADALDELAAGLRARGSSCLAVPGDVTRQEDVERVVTTCIDHYGTVDILVNDAAVQIYAPFDQYTWDEITRVIDVTFLGYLRFARAVLPLFRRQGSGHIVNVASMLSEGAAPLLSIYTAAKHAVLGWSESLRLELLHSGIDVSAVLVPSVATPMFDHAPMKLGRAPKPIPPTYEPDVAARAVLRCLEHPTARMVPVFLQGKLILWLQRYAPWFGDELLARFGAQMQMRPEPVDPNHGNLFHPIPEGVGPHGSVPPTPAWLRVASTTVIFAAAAAAVTGVGWAGYRAARRFTG